jgi:tRNA dimethylallyltransferase
MTDQFKPLLVVIVGPTAVGKTALSIALAQRFHAQILSADSRQFYREMEIGTAKPTDQELASTQHHFVNNLSIQDLYTVGQFEKEAVQLLEHIFEQEAIAIMVGGSGLFVDAVCYGLDDFPTIDPKHRAELIDLHRDKGIGVLQEMLAERDPAYFELVDRQNPQRLMRALEVILETGKTFTSFRNRQKKKRPFDVLKVGLEMDREELYSRIDQRMDLMIEKGLFEEAESLYDQRDLNALQTVGYREIFGFLDQEYDRKEAIRLLKRNSRRFAKRQLTWFKRDEQTKWFHPQEYEQIIMLVQERLESLKTKH